MASAKSYRFLSITPNQPQNSEYEFDESEIWGDLKQSDTSTEWRPPPISRRRSGVIAGGEARSLPVEIPDWSKIWNEKKRGERMGDQEFDLDWDDHDGDEMMAPHEYLARTRTASFSVHEGKGRTLKGRDLSRVRNAIWEKIGFQD